MRKDNGNLIPNSRRTPEEVRKNASKGGKRSGQVRRQKKSIEQAMRMLLEMPANNANREKIAKQTGIPVDQIDNHLVVAVSAYNQALKGNTKAIELCTKFNGDGADSELLKIRRAELKIKQEEHDITMAEFKSRTDGHADEYKGLPALSIAAPFLSVLWAIEQHEYIEYVLNGGRGSTKSSFISLAILDLLEKHPTLSALVMRQVSNTIRGSVYNQLIWAIDYLGLTNEYKCTANPAEIMKISTGQRIFFRGADDPGKVKSIKPTVGYIGIIWFEELDQFNGEESIRKIEQSAMRGGDLAWVFKSFNPPKSALNWANKYIKMPDPKRLVHHSDYRDVPKIWLGKDWVEQADFLKETNPTAYENEYLGIANGTGGNVFDNVEIREITDDEIAQFDRIYHGVDWGWYPDPFDYVRVHYDAARLTLYVFAEYRCNKRSNRQTADTLLNDYQIGGDIVTCDSAEEKSVQDYRTYGIAARGAEKGPGSVEYSMKWLQSLVKIVIDNRRCPDAAREFINYEYDRDKEGNVITGYPDKDNHSIDAVRYAMNPVWKRRGK